MLAGLKDYDSNIDELRSALKAAGWDTYVAEIRKQYDEFLANKCFRGMPVLAQAAFFLKIEMIKIDNKDYEEISG